MLPVSYGLPPNWHSRISALGQESQVQIQQERERERERARESANPTSHWKKC